MRIAPAGRGNVEITNEAGDIGGDETAWHLLNPLFAKMNLPAESLQSGLLGRPDRTAFG